MSIRTQCNNFSLLMGYNLIAVLCSATISPDLRRALRYIHL